MVGVALCLPRLGLGYFWDDYIFLTQSRADPLAFVLTNPTTIFYRPISMGIYFLLLLALGPWGSVAGHFLNLGFFAAAIVLVAMLVATIAGSRAGLYAGFAYASLASAPSLVAWITASQDLIAIVFVLVALHLRHAHRPLGSVLAFAGALFSKEPAVALLPALILWPWILNRKPYRVARYALLCGVALLLWAAVHPAVHAFLAHGFGTAAATGYVHLGHPERWGAHLGRYLLWMFHVPLTGYKTAWPEDLTPYALLALAMLVGGLWIGCTAAHGDTRSERVSWRRIAALAAWIALPPLLLDTVLIGHWAPYYVALPGIGGALLLGASLSRQPGKRAALVLSLFLILGVFCRGIFSGRDLAFTEQHMTEASRAIRLVEKHVRMLRPSIPRGAEILVSVGSTGTLGIHQTMHQGQAPRVWYGDPTLEVRPPEQRSGRGRPEVILRISQSLSVAEIDPDSAGFRWVGDVEPLEEEIAGPIRAYARGTAASGDTDRAVRILRRLGTLPPDSMRPYDRRLTAMVLLAAGRRGEAERLLAQEPTYPRQAALSEVRKLLLEPTGRASVDSSVYEAFGLAPQDTSVVRELMRRFRADQALELAAHFAERLQTLVPGEPESAAILRDWKRLRRP